MVQKVVEPLKFCLYSSVFLGRGFDQEIFQEKDEANLCSYSTKLDGEVKYQKCWDTDHPHMFHSRSNCGYVTLGMLSTLLCILQKDWFLLITLQKFVAIGPFIALLCFLWPLRVS